MAYHSSLNDMGSGYATHQSNRVDRSKLSLDFTQTPRKNDHQNNPCFLDSPDMQMLRVDSPELEKMILDNYPLTAGSSTPTPTQFVNPKIISRNDQQPFSDAVPENIYVNISNAPVKNSRHSMPSVAHATSCNIPQTQQYISNIQTAVQTNAHGSGARFILTNMNAAPKITSSSNGCSGLGPHESLLVAAPSQSDISHQQPQPHSISLPVSLAAASSSRNSNSNFSSFDQYSNSNSPVSVKTEPGNMSSSESVPSNSEQSPVQMPLHGNPALQDKIKQERKRLRNRIAATKCRKRKLEKISTLQDQVSELKRSNFDLSERKQQLRDQIANLKEKMLIHLKHGCQVHVGHNMQAFEPNS